MKHIIFFLFIFFISNEVDANIRRVGFTDVPPVAGVDYTTFFAAYNASSANDTIYVWGGKSLATGWTANGGFPTIGKKLTIVGKGYWLDSTSTPKGNAGLQASIGFALAGNQVEFIPGSEGTIIMGFDFGNALAAISANNITIRRNREIRIFFRDANVSNLIIEGNYKVNFTGVNNISNTWTNLIIRNNFITTMNFMPLKSYTGIIVNNTLAWDNTTPSSNGGVNALSEQVFGNPPNNIELQNGSWIFENNLLVSLTSVSNNTTYTLTNFGSTTFNHNIAIQSNNFTAWPPSGIGNILLTTAQVPSIFEAFPAIATSSADGRYRLKANSPALAGSPQRPAATVDAGMYGGLTPYKLGMIPSIPTIYNISSPQGNTPTGSTMQINISTRSNN